MSETTTLRDGRTLIVVSMLDDRASLPLQAGFVTMLPALSASDLAEGPKLVDELVDRGCAEFCCVGPKSGELHDAIDWVLDDKQANDVATTWVPDVAEASDYFILAAGGKPGCLLAFASDYPELRAALRAAASQVTPSIS
jgi:hypothetical protein